MDSDVKYKLGRKYWYNKIRIYNIDVAAESECVDNACTVAKDMGATPNSEVSDIDILIMPVSNDVMVRFNGDMKSGMKLDKGESLSFEGIMIEKIEFKGLENSCKIRMIVASHVTRRALKMRVTKS